MASIRLTQFAGLMPELSAKLLRKDNAQIAHNCLLYDGRLQAMPAFYNYAHVGQAPKSLLRSVGPIVPEYNLQYAVWTGTAPFATATVGLASPGDLNVEIRMKFGDPGVVGSTIEAGIRPPNYNTFSISVTPMLASRRRMYISYAITRTRTSSGPTGTHVAESSPVLLTPNGIPDYHEGDAVNISMNIFPASSGATGIRLYRTISGLESGEQILNPYDTDWYLVNDSNIASGMYHFIDVQESAKLPGSKLLTRYFRYSSLDATPNIFGLTDSGWYWATTTYGVLFSEKFMVHNWPQANALSVNPPDTISGACSFYDTVFVGTVNKPYRARVADSQGEEIDLHMQPYPEHQPCIPDTMVTAPFGALYTSNQGVVALDSEKMQVVTRELLKGGDVLYSWCADDVPQTFTFSNISKAMWFNGWYLGFSTTGGKIFVYDVPDDLNAEHPFQQLVTMDSPSVTVPQCWATGPYGLHMAIGTELYYWPVPGWLQPADAPTVQKLCYQWKSKKFVMPGRINFAAAKVITACDGEVCFKLYSDCICVYQRKVTDCNPFRLPSNYIGVEFEIELTGTGTVSEVHVATSMRELTESEGE